MRRLTTATAAPDSAVRLEHGDCREVLPTLDAESVDAVVTDPPYHLTAGKKGGQGLASVNLDSPHGRARITSGFMGMKWDGGDVAFDPETWAAVLRVMKPGAHLVAFGGTRTYHRLACAIEDAGFEIRDQLAWVYGSGFPKGTDKAKIPEEWKGWNTALKPAWEPIVLARKPMVGTLAENLQHYECGALNVDGCRIKAFNRKLIVGTIGTKRLTNRLVYNDWNGGSKGAGTTSLGRWPANLMHDGSDEVVAMFPKSDGQQGDVRGTEPSSPTTNCVADRPLRGDSGSAARFFYCAKADREDREHGLHGHEKKPLLWSSGTQNPGAFQSPNTDRSARNHHPTVKPTDLMRWLVKLVTPPGGLVLDPFAGSGSTGRGALLERCEFVGIESEAEYVEIARARIAAVDPDSFSLVTQDNTRGTNG